MQAHAKLPSLEVSDPISDLHKNCLSLIERKEWDECLKASQALISACKEKKDEDRKKAMEHLAKGYYFISVAQAQKSEFKDSFASVKRAILFQEEYIKIAEDDLEAQIYLLKLIILHSELCYTQNDEVGYLSDFLKFTEILKKLHELRGKYMPLMDAVITDYSYPFHRPADIVNIKNTKAAETEIKNEIKEDAIQELARAESLILTKEEILKNESKEIQAELVKIDAAVDILYKSVIAFIEYKPLLALVMLYDSLTISLHTRQFMQLFASFIYSSNGESDKSELFASNALATRKSTLGYYMLGLALIKKGEYYQSKQEILKGMKYSLEHKEQIFRVIHPAERLDRHLASCELQLYFNGVAPIKPAQVSEDEHPFVQYVKNWDSPATATLFRLAQDFIFQKKYKEAEQICSKLLQVKLGFRSGVPLYRAAVRMNFSPALAEEDLIISRWVLDSIRTTSEALNEPAYKANYLWIKRTYHLFKGEDELAKAAYKEFSELVNLNAKHADAHALDKELSRFKNEVNGKYYHLASLPMIYFLFPSNFCLLSPQSAKAFLQCCQILHDKEKEFFKKLNPSVQQEAKAEKKENKKQKYKKKRNIQLGHRLKVVMRVVEEKEELDHRPAACPQDPVDSDSDEDDVEIKGISQTIQERKLQAENHRKEQAARVKARRKQRFEERIKKRVGDKGKAEAAVSEPEYKDVEQEVVISASFSPLKPAKPAKFIDYDEMIKRHQTDIVVDPMPKFVERFYAALEKNHPLTILKGGQLRDAMIKKLHPKVASAAKTTSKDFDIATGNLGIDIERILKDTLQSLIAENKEPNPFVNYEVAEDKNVQGLYHVWNKNPKLRKLDIKIDVKFSETLASKNPKKDLLVQEALAGDFNVNQVFRIKNKVVIPLPQTMTDLQNLELRSPDVCKDQKQSAENSYAQDPIRILRGVDYFVSKNLKIPPEELEAMKKAAPLLMEKSNRKEVNFYLRKLFLSGYGHEVMRQLFKTQLIYEIPIIPSYYNKVGKLMHPILSLMMQDIDKDPGQGIEKLFANFILFDVRHLKNQPEERMKVIKRIVLDNPLYKLIFKKFIKRNLFEEKFVGYISDWDKSESSRSRFKREFVLKDRIQQIAEMKSVVTEVKRWGVNGVT